MSILKNKFSGRDNSLSLDLKHNESTDPIICDCQDYSS